MDIFYWLIMTGYLDVRTEEISDPQMLRSRQPQVSGVGLRGRTLSLQSLAKRGAVILGKIDHTANDMIFLQPNAKAHVKFADEFSKKLKDMINAFINKSHLSFPEPEMDAADLPDDNATCASTLASINLKDNNINSVILTTGFSGDFSYLKLPVFNTNGTLKHRNGISEIEGLYFLGLPWLRKRKSGIIWGIREDVEYLIEKISSRQ